MEFAIAKGSAERWFAAFTLFLGTLVASSPASATACQGDNAHQCWTGLSGLNYSQVAVGRTSAGAGIACAVATSNDNNWGGNVDCFAAVGSSGAYIRGRAGQQAQNPGWFDPTVPTMRINSLAIMPGATSNQVIIYALRSDGNMFQATTRWPIGASEDPRIFFSPTTQTEPAWLRTVSVAVLNGSYVTYATDTSNRVFRINGLAWQQVSSNLVFVAGNQVFGQSSALAGPSGTSLTIIPFNGTTSPPSLPATLALSQTDPNNSFWTSFGRSMPIGMGQQDAWACLGPPPPAAPPPICAGTTPCIVRSTRNGFGAWSNWQVYQTGNEAQIGYAVTVQDGRAMRGARGEVWAIHGAMHLSFYAP